MHAAAVRAITATLNQRDEARARVAALEAVLRECGEGFDTLGAEFSKINARGTAAVCREQAAKITATLGDTRKETQP